MKTDNILKIYSVAKHHDLIQVYYENSTLNEEKIFNFLIYSIKNKRLFNKKINTSHWEINQFLGFTINNKMMKNIFTKMMQTVLEVALLNKKKGSYKLTHFIQEIEYENGSITITFSDIFIDMILNDKNHYCNLNFILINRFKSKYSIRLYENIKRYMTHSNSFIHLPKMEIKTFKRLMGIKEDKYKRISHFKRSVLDIVVNEINAKSDIKISYELFKSGNIYTDILFHSKFKENDKNIIDTALFYDNEKLLDFIDIFLPKYADKKVVGFIDNKEVYFHKTNKNGGKKLVMNDKMGTTVLDTHISMEVLYNCYINRKNFEWFNSDLYELFLQKKRSENYAENFK
ncbi:replication initiation protein [Sulfurimonas sp. NW15]|uniref:replication initiation protein n=1 Tax=Sulfurimonas sp. NW15 TaxID=2922729 RepID=UPI003DA974E4